MNMKLTYRLCFTVGAAVGVASTWQYFKKKYEVLANEEIESVKEAFDKHLNNGVDMHVPTNVESTTVTNGNGNIVTRHTKPDLSEYAGIIKKMDYTVFSKNTTPEDPEVSDEPADDEPFEPPFIINPSDFGEEDGYDITTLTYYSDGTLTDEGDEIIDDVESVVGRESLNIFIDFKVESVYVRNERLKTDYEIISDLRRFDDVLSDGLRHRR